MAKTWDDGRWTEQQARQALAELATSGESSASFARRRGISTQRLAYWRKRLARLETTEFVAVELPGARATNGLKTQKLRGDRLVNCLQVEDGGRAAHIKEIIANAAVSRATALFASEMSKTVFDMDPFTEAVPTGG